MKIMIIFSPTFSSAIHTLPEQNTTHCYDDHSSLLNVELDMRHADATSVILSR